MHTSISLLFWVVLTSIGHVMKLIFLMLGKRKEKGVESDKTNLSQGSSFGTIGTKTS